MKLQHIFNCILVAIAAFLALTAMALSGRVFFFNLKK
jgi:hypothetical protein